MTQNLPATQLFPISDLEKMATSLVKSNLFGIKTMEQAVTLMLVAQAEGLHPATAARDYHIIQGRPAMKADAMLARFQQGGGVVEWDEYSEVKVSGRFRHPQSPKPVLIEWTIEMAKKIGLANKDNWRNYPRQMLRARVISEGVRTCYPAIAAGIYTPEEVGDFKERDITPTAGAIGSLTADRQEIINETAAQIREALTQDRTWDAYSLLEGSDFDADEQVALWALLDSRQRSALKRIQDAERAQAAGKISKSQHKRLEAIIKEKGLDRDEVKAYCVTTFAKEHFTALTKDEYEALDTYLSALPKAAAAPAGTPSSHPIEHTGGGAAPDDGAESDNDEGLIAEIESWCKRKKFDVARDLARGIDNPKARTDTEARIKTAEDYVKAKAGAV